MRVKPFSAAYWLRRIQAGDLRTDIENSIMIMLGCTLLGLLFYMLGLSEANIISIYILGILLIASVTTAQVFCLISSGVGIVLFNCLFAEPRFTLHVFDPQYLITASIMLAASLVTSAVMTSFRQKMTAEIALYKEKERISRMAEDERLRANLLRTVSHDLRTPLAGIAGSANVLLTSGEQIAPEQRRQMYQSIHDDAEWLISLTENLLFATRLQNSAPTLELQPELLQEIIPEALTHLNKRDKNHLIELDMPEELLMVRVDARLIMQVIINMADNAIKYAPAATRIIVRAGTKQQKAFVEVADCGPGLSREDKERVFDMFYTAGNSTGERGGIGLGLALSQSIIQAHGGEIYVRDNEPQGSVFGFILPLEGMF